MSGTDPSRDPISADAFALEVQEAAEEMADQPERWQEKLAEIADWCADELRAARDGIDRAEARRLGCRLAVRLCREVGGANYYWPKGSEFERAVLHLTLWSSHDGTVDGPNGIRALARRHRLTDVAVWRILRRQRLLHWRAIQPALPGLDEPAPQDPHPTLSQGERGSKEGGPHR